MSTMTSTSSSVPSTTLATIQIVQNANMYYGTIIVSIFGIIGCLCNFITFTAPQLRKTSCAFYFLLSAVFELLSITFGLISRFAADQLGSTLINTDRAYCKLRAYLVSALPLVATYLMLLSSIDRCMSSSVSARLRSFSQMKMAYRASGVAVVISFVSCSHILVGYDLRPRCGALAGGFAMYDGMFVVFWLGVIPHVLMLVFGFVTWMNVRRTKKRIAVTPTTTVTTPTQQQRREQKTDTQLIAMMLMQTGISSILIMTRMVCYAYYILKPTATGYERLVDLFLMSFTIILYYANYAKSFYVYTLASRLFRSVFIKRMRFCIRKILGRYTPSLLNINTGHDFTATVVTRIPPTAKYKK